MEGGSGVWGRAAHRLGQEMLGSPAMPLGGQPELPWSFTGCVSTTSEGFRMTGWGSGNPISRPDPSPRPHGPPRPRPTPPGERQTSYQNRTEKS